VQTGHRVKLLLTPGMGVGPEVTLRALAADGFDDLVLVGRAAAVRRANADIGLPLVAINTLDEPVGDRLGILDPGDATEPTEVAAIRLSAHACLSRAASGIVTGPIHKAQLAARGFRHNGHTDFLEALCRSARGEDGRAVMAFVGGDLRVALVTTHMPLMAVGPALSRADIGVVVRTMQAALTRDLGLDRPRIAVCGLNPHAGEDGLLGREEIEIIGPACDELRADGLHIVGPVSAETAFLEAGNGQVDLIVAMYHDQGLAPLKAVDFGRSVNWTVGLPIVRTSVDHGTADALVGTGRADDASMRAALALARRITRQRAGR
jgi:4-hydroxythreonine-4-phosphate dehydrogenase